MIGPQITRKVNAAYFRRNFSVPPGLSRPVAQTPSRLLDEVELAEVGVRVAQPGPADQGVDFRVG